MKPGLCDAGVSAQVPPHTCVSLEESPQEPKLVSVSLSALQLRGCGRGQVVRPKVRSMVLPELTVCPGRACCSDSIDSGPPSASAFAPNFAIKAGIK